MTKSSYSDTLTIYKWHFNLLIVVTILPSIRLSDYLLAAKVILNPKTFNSEIMQMMQMFNIGIKTHSNNLYNQPISLIYSFQAQEQLQVYLSYHSKEKEIFKESLMHSFKVFGISDHAWDIYLCREHFYNSFQI